MKIEKETGNCILIADDDGDDQYMIAQAFITLECEVDIRTVNDGLELMDYLERKDKYEHAVVPVPKVILLDLNMPKKDGRECLKEIKAHPELKKIPVVVYSTSNSPNDVSYCYAHGASNYIVKPSSFKELIEVMKVFRQYWFTVVKTPDIIL